MPTYQFRIRDGLHEPSQFRVDLRTRRAAQRHALSLADALALRRSGPDPDWKVVLTDEQGGALLEVSRRPAAEAR
jgi:hypothetical protein